MSKDIMIGVDLAKNVFQLHAASMTGQPLFRKKLSRQNFPSFMANQTPAVVVMEACGSAHHWAREMISFGHEVKLIAPHARERLVHQRTELVNALRAGLYEYGHAVPQGIRQIRQIEEILCDPNSDLPDLMREECLELLKQIAETTVRIDARTAKIKALSADDDTARRLQTMPGIGPMTALAVEAFAPPMNCFRHGRDFAAWLGLVPRQFSSGGKERLGRLSKAGQADIRRLLIIGAMSRLNWMGRKSIPQGSWLERMAARKPKMLVAIALANKMARMIWAMLTKNENYRYSAQAAVA